MALYVSSLPLSRSVGVALLVSTLLAVRPCDAEAANTDERADFDSKTSLSRYREAYRAMDRKDWHTARAILLELWPKTRTYDVAASLGQVEYQLQNYASAARYVAFAIDHVAPKERPESLERYKAALAQLRTHVASVRVTVNEPNAEIRVNGDSVGSAPLSSELFLDPGSYVLEAKTGDRGVSRKVDVERGRAYAFELTLPDRAVAAAREAAVRVAPSPTPVAAEPAPTDRRLGSERSRVPLWIGLGVTAVGVGGAIGFGLAAQAAQDDARLHRSRLGPTGCSSGAAAGSECQAATEAIDRQHRNATLSTVSLGVAAAGALGTLGYWLFWPKTEPRTALRLRPSIGLVERHAGLRVEGGF